MDQVGLGYFDGDNVTDVLTIDRGQLAVFWSGRTAWQFLAALDGIEGEAEAQLVPSFVGRFDRAPGADLLTVDLDAHKASAKLEPELVARIEGLADWIGAEQEFTDQEWIGS